MGYELITGIKLMKLKTRSTYESQERRGLTTHVYDHLED
jgi:hypothetical protein